MRSSANIVFPHCPQQLTKAWKLQNFLPGLFLPTHVQVEFLAVAEKTVVSKTLHSIFPQWTCWLVVFISLMITSANFFLISNHNTSIRKVFPKKTSRNLLLGSYKIHFGNTIKKTSALDLEIFLRFSSEKFHWTHGTQFCEKLWITLCCNLKKNNTFFYRSKSCSLMFFWTSTNQFENTSCKIPFLNKFLCNSFSQ